MSDLTSHLSFWLHSQAPTSVQPTGQGVHLQTLQGSLHLAMEGPLSVLTSWGWGALGKLILDPADGPLLSPASLFPQATWGRGQPDVFIALTPSSALLLPMKLKAGTGEGVLFLLLCCTLYHKGVICSWGMLSTIWRFGEKPCLIC